jgi:hypothetical protein
MDPMHHAGAPHVIVFAIFVAFLAGLHFPEFHMGGLLALAHLSAFVSRLLIGHPLRVQHSPYASRQP